MPRPPAELSIVSWGTRGPRRASDALQPLHGHPHRYRSFRYSNVTPETFRIAGELVAAGPMPAFVSGRLSSGARRRSPLARGAARAHASRPDGMWRGWPSPRGPFPRRSSRQRSCVELSALDRVRPRGLLPARDRRSRQGEPARQGRRGRQPHRRALRGAAIGTRLALPWCRPLPGRDASPGGVAAAAAAEASRRDPTGRSGVLVTDKRLGVSRSTS